MNLIINNGLIATSEDLFYGNILIENGKIAKISTEQLSNDYNYKVIDAEKNIVMPGGVDVHTHLDMPFMGSFSTDDFYTGTVAAAYGGTTSIIDYVIPQKNQSFKDAYLTWQQKSVNKAVIDYGFHMAIVPPVDFEDFKSIKKLGISSVKCFLAYKNSLMIDDNNLHKLMAACKEHNILLCVHAEDGNNIEELTNKYLNQNKTEPIYHALSRPSELEGKAVNKVLNIAKQTTTNVYFVHLSTKYAIDEINSHKNFIFNIYTETCPQYLIYSQDMYLKNNFEGAKFVMSPPLREKEHKDYLINSIKSGDIDVVATDHCPFNFYKEKQCGRNDFTKIPNGIPGIEIRMPLMYTKLVNEKIININKFVQIFCTNPAKIFGLKNKGDIKVGLDADICIWNTNINKKITKSMLHENVDYSPYEDEKISAIPITTISRGEVIVENFNLTANAGRGKYIFRE